MQKKTALISGAAALVLILGGVGVAVAVNSDDDERLSGTTLERASNAALAEVGTGTVTSADRTNDNGASYAIEVRLDNGDDVDVELDDSFEVIWVGNVDTNDDDNNDSSAAPSATAEAAAAAAAAAASAAAAAEAATAPSADVRASAEAAALAAVGSGTVTEFDISDDNDHLYEVEVTLAGGEDRDVELDANFTVLRIDDVAL